MSTKNRIVLATFALLTVGAVVVAAYAQENAQPNPNQPNPNQPGTPQVGATQPGTQPGTTQPGTLQPGTMQPGMTQPVPYRVNRIPGNAAQGEMGIINQQGQQDLDLFLIPCLINANNAEVTLGNLATQRAQSKEVKEFAEEMVKDHTAGAKEFQQLQTTLNQQLRPQNPASTPVAAALFQIQQQIEQTCLADTQRELEQQGSSDFDRCYMGVQVGMHMQLTSVLSVLKNHATSPDLKKAIENTSQLVSRHLEHAKKIVKDLENRETRENRSSVNR